MILGWIVTLATGTTHTCYHTAHPGTVRCKRSMVCSVRAIGEPYCQAGTRSAPTAAVIEGSYLYILVSKRRIGEELEVFPSKHPPFTLYHPMAPMQMKQKFCTIKGIACK